MPINLIIFDLDGTLTDSLDDLTDAVNWMLARFARPALTAMEVRRLVGQGARRLVERALAGASAAEIEEGIALFLDYNEAHIADKTRLYPGVRATLNTLIERGIRLAVISNKNVRLCRRLLETLEADEYFEAVLGADSVSERKPSPVPVLQLLGETGVTAEAAVLVGDSINDIAAGQGAGVVTIGCRYGYGDAAELADADFWIDAFDELLGLPVFKPAINEEKA
jgi:phosphoglycolate phosphatase